MDKRIIYTREDGGVSVVIPCQSIDESLTEDEMVQRAWDRLPNDAINPQIVTVDDLPADRSKRADWVLIGSTISVKGE